MTRRIADLPTWCKLMVVAVAAMFTLRYLGAIESGVSHELALRTYLFWALVCAPVAYLADMVLRSVMEYRVVRLAVARVKGDRSS